MSSSRSWAVALVFFFYYVLLFPPVVSGIVRLWLVRRQPLHVSRHVNLTLASCFAVVPFLFVHKPLNILKESMELADLMPLHR